MGSLSEAVKCEIAALGLCGGFGDGNVLEVLRNSRRGWAWATGDEFATGQSYLI